MGFSCAIFFPFNDLSNVQLLIKWEKTHSDIQMRTRTNKHQYTHFTREQNKTTTKSLRNPISSWECRAIQVKFIASYIYIKIMSDSNAKKKVQRTKRNEKTA